MEEQKKPNPLLIAAPIIAIVAVVVIIELFSGSPNDRSGEKPTSITVQQAQTALSQLIPNVTVESVSPSPIEGVWEMVVVTPQGKRIAYIDVEGKFLLSGAIVELATKTDLTRARSEELNKVDFASVPLDDAIVLGNPKAAKKVVVFDDPD